MVLFHRSKVTDKPYAYICPYTVAITRKVNNQNLWHKSVTQVDLYQPIPYPTRNRLWRGLLHYWPKRHWFAESVLRRKLSILVGKSWTCFWFFFCFKRVNSLEFRILEFWPKTQIDVVPQNKFVTTANEGDGREFFIRVRMSLYLHTGSPLQAWSNLVIWGSE